MFLAASAIFIWQPCSIFGDSYILGAEDQKEENQNGETITGTLRAITEEGEVYEEGIWTSDKLSLQYEFTGQKDTTIQFACIEEGSDWSGETHWQEMILSPGADMFEAKLPELESGIYQVYIRTEEDMNEGERETEKETEEPKEEGQEMPSGPSAMLRLMIDYSAPEITALKLCERVPSAGQEYKDMEITNEVSGRKITGNSFLAAVSAEDLHSGINGFWYRWNTDEKFRFRKADNKGRARLPAAPEGKSCEGRFEVYAEDKAGNCSINREALQYLYDVRTPVIDEKQMKLHPLSEEGNVDYSVDLAHISSNSVKYWQKYGTYISGISVHDIDEFGGISSGIKKIWAEKNGRTIKCQVEPAADGSINDGRKRSVKLKVTGDSIDASGDRIRIFAEDQAGNRAVSKEIIIKTDYEKPEPVKITLLNSSGKPLLPFPSFDKNRYFSNQPVTAVLEAEDRLSGIGEIHYRVGDKEPFRKVSGSRKTLLLMPGYEGRITAYAVDRTGNSNELYPSRSGETVTENTPPEIMIESSPDAGKWQRDNIHFQIHVRDNMTASGLKSVVCRMDGEKIVSKDYTEAEVPRKEDMLEVTAAEESRKQEGYLLEVEAADLAGNCSVKKVRVRIDKKPPEVWLSGVEDGGVYKENKSVYLKFREQNYKGMEGEVLVTRAVPEGRTERNTIKFKMDSEECLRDFACTEEGIYTLVIRAWDAAGNQMKEQRFSFTIDKTSPEVRLSGVNEGEYYNQPVSVKLTVTEAFYENNTVKISGTKELDGKKTSVAPDRWSSKGIHTEWMQSFTEDGTYNIFVQAEDEAGNRSGEERISFIVDRTPPKITVDGITDYDISAAPVQFGIKVAESFYETSKIRMSAVRESQEGHKTVEKLEPFIPAGKETEQKFRFREDGIYTLTVRADDRAGNHTEEIRRLIIDTEDPVIRFIGQIDGRYLKEFKLPDRMPVVDDLTVPKYKIYLNGLEYNENDIIQREGSYRLRIEAEDEAGHKSRAGAKFIIDRTPPEIKWSGIGDSKVKNSPVNLSLQVEEGEKLEEITINGKKQLKKPAGKYNCRLEDPGTYMLKATAVDQAGNQVTEEKRLEIQLGNDSDDHNNKIMPILIFSAIGGVAAAALIAVGIPIMLLRVKE